MWEFSIEIYICALLFTWLNYIHIQRSFFLISLLAMNENDLSMDFNLLWNFHNENFANGFESFTFIHSYLNAWINLNILSVQFSTANLCVENCEWYATAANQTKDKALLWFHYWVFCSTFECPHLICVYNRMFFILNRIIFN